MHNEDTKIIVILTLNNALCCVVLLLKSNPWQIDYKTVKFLIISGQDLFFK